MVNFLKGVGAANWMKIIQQLGVAGVALYMLWHFGNRILDNDAEFRQGIVETQKDISEASKNISNNSTRIREAMKQHSSSLTALEKYHAENVGHIKIANEFMKQCAEESKKQTQALEVLLKREPPPGGKP